MFKLCCSKQNVSHYYVIINAVSFDLQYFSSITSSQTQTVKHENYLLLSFICIQKEDFVSKHIHVLYMHKGDD